MESFSLKEVVAPSERPLKSSDDSQRLQVVNPLEVSDWDRVLSQHAGSSFFHTSSWARVLHDTYGHRPLYFCRFAEARLQELLAVMEVSSRVTGCRGVSLPFTDGCSLLSSSRGDVSESYAAAMEQGRLRRWRHLECRHDGGRWPGAVASVGFWGHVLELKAGPEALFKGFEGALRRGIRKAEASELRVEFHNNEESVAQFFQLHCATRRRHGVPPQPKRFFDNIARYVIEAGHGWVAQARLGDQPIAAAIFFHWGQEAIYKFGASDYRFQHLRPNNLLMWFAIRRYAEEGFARLDLGRTSLVNEGLRRFKLGFGAGERKLEYCKYDFRSAAFVTDVDRANGWVNSLFRRLPLGTLRLAGRVLYPHLA